MLTQGLRGAVKAFMREPKSAPVTPPIGTEWFQEAGRQIDARGLFIGCPLEVFEYSSKDPLCVALMAGITPDSSVLEVGCGCLRVGHWLIWYLNNGKYCGIEPNERMLEAGKELILRHLVGEKSPRFDFNDTFDFSVFATKFDFVMAFSIWTHASKCQISNMLDEFKKCANPGAKFIASWLPPLPDRPDYQGTSWVGRSHQSNTPGIVGHSLEWVQQEVASRGLSLKVIEGFKTLHQQWLVIGSP